ncbi:ankyrin repeat-containing domain protein [Zopfochytrium polystomum]|nr:ankyrin repeat-containing domain protein [Zopfochytrium polystomum]
MAGTRSALSPAQWSAAKEPRHAENFLHLLLSLPAGSMTSASSPSPSSSAAGGGVFPIHALPDEIVYHIGLFSPPCHRLAFPTGALSRALHRIFSDPRAIAVRSLRFFYSKVQDEDYAYDYLPAERRAIVDEASRGAAAVVEYLLDKLGDAAASEIDLRGAMEEAARNGHVAVVQVLLAHGATAIYSMALRSAAANGHVDVVQAILESGRWAPSDRDGALAPAVRSGAPKERRAAVLELLLDHGANDSAYDGNSLESAVKLRDLEALGLLVDRCRVGPPLAIDDALEALREANVDVIRLLLRAGAQPHKVHWEVLLALVLQGQFELLSSLVPNQSMSEITLLRLAFSQNRVDGVKALLFAFPSLTDALQNETYLNIRRFRADIDDSEALVTGALHEAALEGNFDMVTFCLELGADPLSQSAEKALGHAITAIRAPMVEALLGASVPVSERHVELSADACLQDPSSPGRFEILNLLLSRGADPRWAEQTFVSAVEWGRYDLVAALLKFETKGWPISTGDMVRAVVEGSHFRVAELLLESGIGDSELFCKAALVAAAKSGRVDVVEWVLLEAGKRELSMEREVEAAASGATDDVKAMLRSRFPSCLE